MFSIYKINLINDAHHKTLLQTQQCAAKKFPFRLIEAVAFHAFVMYVGVSISKIKCLSVYAPRP